MSLLSKLKFSRRIWSIEKKIGQKIFLLSQRLRNCKFRRDFNLIFFDRDPTSWSGLRSSHCQFSDFLFILVFSSNHCWSELHIYLQLFFHEIATFRSKLSHLRFFFNLENGHDIFLWFQNQFSFSSWANPGRMSMDSDSLAKLLNLFLIHFHALWRQHFNS